MFSTRKFREHRVSVVKTVPRTRIHYGSQLEANL